MAHDGDFDICARCGGLGLFTPDERARGHCEACAYIEMHPDAPLLSLDELDKLLDELGDIPQEDQGLAYERLFDSLIGRKVDWHSSVATIVRSRHGRLRLDLRLLCARCHANPTTVHLGNGLHRGARPYVFDADDQEVANLRDHEYVCEACDAHAKGWLS